MVFWMDGFKVCPSNLWHNSARCQILELLIVHFKVLYYELFRNGEGGIALTVVYHEILVVLNIFKWVKSNLKMYAYDFTGTKEEKNLDSGGIVFKWVIWGH